MTTAPFPMERGGQGRGAGGGVGVQEYEGEGLEVTRDGRAHLGAAGETLRLRQR